MEKLNKGDFNCLTRNIINSDFLILDTKSYRHSKFQKKYKILSINEVIKNIKEFCRTLKLLNNKSNFQLLIYVENNFNKSILDLLLQNINKDIKIVASTAEISKKLSFSSILIVIGNIEDNKLKSLLSNNIYLMHIISEQISPIISGTYNMQNSVLNIKKLIFLATILLTIIKDYKNA
jgi:hypothetical protein